MANNYEQATMQPELPASWFSAEELALLKAQGWTYFPQNPQPTDMLYFVIEEGECYDPDSHEKSWKDILQEKLEAHDKGIILTILGAYTCDKMRAGEFGGYAQVIAWNREEYRGTHEMAADLRAEVQETLATPKEEIDNT